MNDDAKRIFGIVTVVVIVAWGAAYAGPIGQLFNSAAGGFGTAVHALEPPNAGAAPVGG